MLPAYNVQSFTDFNKPENDAAMKAALAAAKAELGKTYPLVIGGKTITLKDTFASINPARPAEVIGNFANGTADHADQAVAAATEAFKTWQHVPVQDRARYLLRAAAGMKRGTNELND